MSRGRPTLYTPELQAKADEYIEKGFIELDHVVPSIQGLAEWLGICDSTIEVWAHHDDKPDFIGTLRKIRLKQHNMALGRGLDGTHNAAITKLLLYNHGYSEKTESVVENKNPVTVNISEDK